MDPVPSANNEAASTSNVDIITTSDQDAIIKKEAAAEERKPMDSVAIGNEAASSNNDKIQLSSKSPSEIGPGELLQAAAYGDTEPFKSVEQLHLILTPGKNTVLHINISERFSTKFLEKILEISPSLLLQENAQGDTPLHVAVKLERGDVVESLIKQARAQQDQDVEKGIGAVSEMLRMKNKKGNTALHEAMRNHSIRVVETYVKEDPDFPYSDFPYLDNYCGESPLYIGAENGFLEGVVKLLETNTSVAHKGPNKKTVLHAAARMGFSDCRNLVDKREWNVLHFAMATMGSKELRILAATPLIRSLVHEKDAKGNTPLHVFAAVGSDREFKFVKKKYGGENAVNKRNATASNIIEFGCPELKKEIRELADANDGPYPQGVIRRSIFPDEKHIKKIEKIRNSHLVVAALIATVTFAAGYTLPGGFKNEEGTDKGTAILSKKSAFQAFVITNSIAMVLSATAVLQIFLAPIGQMKYLFMLQHAAYYTMVAMGSMVVAFITGSYAVLSPSLGLSIANMFIGLTFFLLVFYMHYRIVKEL